jgi:hypothetical protein
MLTLNRAEYFGRVRLAPCLLDAEEGTFDSNGVKIRYVTEGAGEAVVLIHGWMADSSMWGRDPFDNTRLNASGADHMTTLIKP